MFIKTESGIILNWDAISKVVVEPHTSRGNTFFTPPPNCKVVAYLAHSNSPIVISYCHFAMAREIMDAIEEALSESLTHPDLGSIFAKRQLARELAGQNANE